MSVRTKHDENDCIFFCTITCYNWIHLFLITEFYNEIYKWFDLLSKKNCKIHGYVIMPNHLHFLIYIPDSDINVNTLISNGKRFMAYKILSRLKISGNLKILAELSSQITGNERKKGQLHHVFQSSFDAKPCYEEDIILSKLDYLHYNPVNGKWNLVEDYTDYLHSSAKFYELNEQGVYPVVHFREYTG